MEAFYAEQSGKWIVLDDRVRHEFDDREMAEAFLADRYDEDRGCDGPSHLAIVR